MKQSITVVGGYHFGYKPIKKGSKKRKPYIFTGKEYYFRVTKKTHKTGNMKLGRAATVLTHQGKSKLVIHDIQSAKTSVEAKRAKELMPVIVFNTYGITNKWINQLYHRIILDK